MAGIKVTIANVCTRSVYAPYLPETTATRIDQVTAARAAEDVHFAAKLVLNAGTLDSRVCFMDFGWKDAPVRKGIEDDEVLRCQNPEQAEIGILSKHLSDIPSDSIVLTPTGLGGHLDHLLVREAACAAFPHGRLLFYEDLPYACRVPATARTSKSIWQDAYRLQEWSSPAVSKPGLKRDYALCYPSQIASEVADEMESYGLALGSRERYFGHSEAIRSIEALLQRQGITA